MPSIVARNSSSVGGRRATDRKLQPPFIRERVTAERKLQSVPLEDEAHRPIQRVDRGNAADGDAMVDQLVDALTVELGDLEHLTTDVNSESSPLLPTGFRDGTAICDHGDWAFALSSEERETHAEVALLQNMYLTPTSML